MLRETTAEGKAVSKKRDSQVKPSFTAEYCLERIYLLQQNMHTVVRKYPEYYETQAFS